MVEKKGQQIREGVSPPPFRAMPERKHFFYRMASLRKNELNIELNGFLALFNI